MSTVEASGTVIGYRVTTSTRTGDGNQRIQTVLPSFSRLLLSLFVFSPCFFAFPWPGARPFPPVGGKMLVTGWSLSATNQKHCISEQLSVILTGSIVWTWDVLELLSLRIWQIFVRFRFVQIKLYGEFFFFFLGESFDSSDDLLLWSIFRVKVKIICKKYGKYFFD